MLEKCLKKQGQEPVGDKKNEDQHKNSINVNKISALFLLRGAATDVLNEQQDCLISKVCNRYNR